MAKKITAIRQPYVINRADDGKSAEVNLYGEIVETAPLDWDGNPWPGLFICLDAFLNDLDRLSGMDKVTFRINSIGGDANAGVAIHNRIRELKGETVTIVDGEAASAAAIIAQAGDRRYISPGAQMMIHGCSMLMFGFYNSDNLKKALDCVNSTDKAIAGLLASRTGLDEDVVLRRMQKTTWMTADEAVKDGFADEITPVPDKAGDTAGAAQDFGRDNSLLDRAPLMVASGSVVQGFIPGYMQAMTGRPKFNKGASGTEPPGIHLREGGKKPMELQELKDTYPELVEAIRNETTAALQAAQQDAVPDMEQIVADALAEERARLQEIESIQNLIGDKALLEDAKYVHPVTAQELAYQAMKASAAAGAAFLQDRQAEVVSSGAQDITPDPVTASEEDTRRKDIEDGAAMIAGTYRKEEK